MKTHDERKWFKDLLDEFKDDVDFISEGKIIDITEKIVARMEEINITRKQLAERLNVSKAYITKMLRGNINFTLKTLVALGKVLDCDMQIDFSPKGSSRYVFHCHVNQQMKITNDTIEKHQPVNKSFNQDVSIKSQDMKGEINVGAFAA